MIFISKLNHWLWSETASFVLIRRILQTIQRLIEHILEEEFRERAQSLAYTTLLSLVPLIAVSFSILKSFGVHQQLIPVLEQAFKPLGERGPEAISALVGFVENVQVGVLGGVGLAILFYTVISLLSSIESQFNKIWGIQKGRALGRRVTDYLVVVLVGPVLAFAALSLFSSHFVSSVLGHVPLQLNAMLGQTTSLLLLTLTMAFIYSFITHRRINLIPSLFGGLFAALSWLTVGSIFANFVATSGNYSGIYSGFASVILFMLWTYISWLIVLLGNQLACYIQCPERLATPITNANAPKKVRLLIELEEIDSTNQIWAATNTHVISKKKHLIP